MAVPPYPALLMAAVPQWESPVRLTGEVWRPGDELTVPQFRVYGDPRPDTVTVVVGGFVFITNGTPVIETAARPSVSLSVVTPEFVEIETALPLVSWMEVGKPYEMPPSVMRPSHHNQQQPKV